MYMRWCQNERNNSQSGVAFLDSVLHRPKKKSWLCVLFLRPALYSCIHQSEIEAHPANKPLTKSLSNMEKNTNIYIYIYFT